MADEYSIQTAWNSKRCWSVSNANAQPFCMAYIKLVQSSNTHQTKKENIRQTTKGTWLLS